MTEERFAELTVNLWRAYQHAVEASKSYRGEELDHANDDAQNALGVAITELNNALMIGVGDAMKEAMDNAQEVAA